MTVTNINKGTIMVISAYRVDKVHFYSKNNFEQMLDSEELSLADVYGMAFEVTNLKDSSKGVLTYTNVKAFGGTLVKPGYTITEDYLEERDERTITVRDLHSGIVYRVVVSNPIAVEDYIRQNISSPESDADE